MNTLLLLGAGFLGYQILKKSGASPTIFGAKNESNPAVVTPQTASVLVGKGGNPAAVTAPGPVQIQAQQAREFSLGEAYTSPDGRTAFETFVDGQATGGHIYEEEIEAWQEYTDNFTAREQQYLNKFAEVATEIPYREPPAFFVPVDDLNLGPAHTNSPSSTPLEYFLNLIPAGLMPSSEEIIREQLANLYNRGATNSEMMNALQRQVMSHGLMVSVAEFGADAYEMLGKEYRADADIINHLAIVTLKPGTYSGSKNTVFIYKGDPIPSNIYRIDLIYQDNLPPVLFDMIGDRLDPRHFEITKISPEELNALRTIDGLTI